MIPGQHPTWLAAILSMLIPGTGQMFNRQFVKGVIFMAFAGVASIVLPPACILVWLVGVLDATLIGNRLREGQTITDFQTF